MKRILKILAALLLAVLLLLIGAVSWVAGTETGLKQSLALAQEYAPGSLAWDEVSGKLIGPLRVRGLHYEQSEGIKADVGALDFDWRPSALLSGEVAVEQLHVDDIELHLAEAAEPEEPPAPSEGLPDISLPVSISLNDIAISNVAVFPAGQTSPVEIKRVAMAGNAAAADVQLADLQIIAPQGQVAVQGELETHDAYPMDLRVSWSTELLEQGPLQGEGTLKGDLESLNIDHNISGLLEAKIQGLVTSITEDLAWDALVTARLPEPDKLSPLLSDVPTLALSSQGQLDAFTASANASADTTVSGPVKLSTQLEGSTQAITISSLLAKLPEVDGQLSLSGDVDLTSLESQVEGQWQNLRWPLTEGDVIASTPQGEFSFSGTPEDFIAALDGTLDSADYGRVEIALQSHAKDQRLNLDSLTAQSSDGPLQLDLAGWFDTAAQSFSADGTWQSLSWPLQGTPQVTSDSGSLQAEGTLEAFSAKVETSIDGESLPAGSWQVELDGSQTALEQFKLLGETLGGKISASGSAAWSGDPEWDVALKTTAINPGLQWSQFPGRINLNVLSQGSIADGEPQLTALIQSLSGTLRDQPLDGSGEIVVQSEAVRIDSLALSHGPTRLSAAGSIDQALDLEFDLNSPNLATLLPDLSGAINVEGTVGGTQQAPHIDANGNASQLRYAENAVDSLRFDIEGGLGEGEKFAVSLNSDTISAGGQEIRNLKVSAQGTQQSHGLTLSAETDQGNLDTEIRGGLDAQTWQGQLASLLLRDTPAGSWTLRSPSKLVASAENASLEQACLDNARGHGSLCLQGDWRASGEAGGQLTISGLSPDIAEQYLPPGLLVQTDLNGTADAKLDSNGQLNADARFVVSAGTITLNADTSPVEIGLEESQIDANWRGNRGSLSVDSAFEQIGSLNLNATLDDPAGNGDLEGRFQTDFSDLSIISAFAPQLQQVGGRLESDLALDGTLQAPLIEGELALRDFTAEIPETAMLIEDTQLSLSGQADGTLKITGQSKSGEGDLQLNGNYNPRTRGLDLDIDGQAYQVANTAMMQAEVSPALNIVMNSDGMRVEGEVTIPSAYINANGGNEGIKTVSPSSDVVYVSEEGTEEAQAASQLNVDVKVILGDSVEVEAGDFRGRLKGDLRVEQTPELAPRGTGTIEVVNGDYVIYGQQLNMERGRILFSGGPVDNPRLDMDVARTVEAYDVVAGAKIRGTAQSPLLELYSEPPMPDASVLSYILLGQPPGTKGGSYTLGKYLTPDLYVSYGIGLFNAINTFNMRYSLTDKLAVQAESGSGSSADLIYTIEK